MHEAGGWLLDFWATGGLDSGSPASKPIHMEMSSLIAESVGFLSWASRQRCRLTMYCTGQLAAYCSSAGEAA